MKYLIILLIGILISCSNSSNQIASYPNYTNIVTIDSCEYIIYKNGYSGNIIHKQNCRNHESGSKEKMD